MTVYIHISKAKKTKLESSEKNDTFVGYRVFHMDIDSEEHMAPLVVRQTTPPSTNSEEARVQRESALRIQ
jgi:hypothetical protein